MRLPAVLAGVLIAACAAQARAEPVRILVAVGHSEGRGDERPLKHTRDDAARVRDVLRSRGGVAAEAAIVLANPTAADLTAALARADTMARTHRPDEVTLFFYFSGHGDGRAMHFGRETVPFTDLAAQLGKIPARLRVVITDACRSSDAVREKGGVLEPAFVVNVDEMRSASGAVWIHASSDGEAAQESDALGGAVFTHYWATGLNGAADANGDGRVTLSESFAFAYDQTVFRTANSSRIPQRPSLALDLRESAPLVLTRTSATNARLVLPREGNVSYVVYAVGSRTVLSEAWGQDDRAISLALPAGRYIVHRRASGRAGAAELLLAAGETRDLRDPDFRPFTEESLAAKGGTLRFHAHEVGVGYGVAVGHLAPFGHGPIVQYAYRGDEWTWSAHVGLVFSSRDAERATETSRRWEAGVALEREWRTGSASFRLGGGPVVSYYDRTLQRPDADLLARGGYSAEISQQTVAPGVELHAFTRWSLGTRLWCGLRIQGTANVATLDGTRQILLHGAASPMLGADF
ncbi:caspase family protein [Pendulispora brunnea]|uniref:Caspase family protein n=1 Tax=Pendulispora brunnea TaxID=2905690 RepID=A0ABZ2KM90_9BACT